MEALKKSRVLSAGLALSLGMLGARAASANAQSANAEKKCGRVVTEQVPLGDHITYNYIYRTNCTRVTLYHFLNDINPPDKSYQRCDGNDFVSVSLERFASSNETRIHPHEACDDGRLTQADFPEDPSIPR